LLGYFSGFPKYQFPRDIAERLLEEITQRNSMVYVCADPTDHEKTDYYMAIMRECSEAIGLNFAQYHVIDNRVKISQATQWIERASCVHLMGGHPGLQIQFLRDTGLDDVIRDTNAAILGVSAGAINMGVHSLDTKESLVPYKGLGLADITIKPHFEPNNQQVLSDLLYVSMELPICAMEDDSAIFVAGDRVSSIGEIHWINKGNICPIWQGGLLL